MYVTIHESLAYKIIYCSTSKGERDVLLAEGYFTFFRECLGFLLFLQLSCNSRNILMPFFAFPQFLTFFNKVDESRKIKPFLILTLYFVHPSKFFKAERPFVT